MQSAFFQEKYNSIALGHRLRINIPIARLPSHTLLDMPVFVYKGKEKGHNLLLTAGIHGDEINGIVILRRLISEKYLMPDAGTVIAVPLVNIYGFLQNSRNLPDGKDLNRCFPGTQTGSIASQIACIVSKIILPNVDFGVDFHTGGNKIGNYPQIRCVLSDKKNMELAHYFAPPFILQSELIDKSFRKEAAKKNKSILVYEGGESLRLDELSIQEGVRGIKRLMHHLGMKKNSDLDLSRKSVILEKTSWLRAKTAGIFDCRVLTGDFVRKNQILAHI
ncbi:MAG: succinylglutamate desuccinylase/aspartoacylase family protein, partial [Raineya sp.]